VHRNIIPIVKPTRCTSVSIYYFKKCLLLYVQSQIPDDGQKDRLKHVGCHSKINKFDTLVHVVGFTNRNEMKSVYCAV